VATENEKGREAHFLRQLPQHVIIDNLGSETGEKALTLTRVSHFEVFTDNC
jgi:hypothetical protein